MSIKKTTSKKKIKYWTKSTQEIKRKKEGKKKRKEEVRGKRPEEGK